jgi:hypothetical protein
MRRKTPDRAVLLRVDFQTRPIPAIADATTVVDRHADRPCGGTERDLFPRLDGLKADVTAPSGHAVVGRVYQVHGGPSEDLWFWSMTVHQSGPRPRSRRAAGRPAGV